MAELFNLTAAEVTPPITTTNYRVILLSLHWEQSLIVIHLRGEHGELREFRYGGTSPGVTDGDRMKALNLMIALNKASLTTISLQKRILNQLVADGLLVGSVIGTPD